MTAKITYEELEHRVKGLDQQIRKLEQVEMTLQSERDFISAVLSTAGVLVVVLDREGRIVRFNRACEKLTKYSFDEVQDKYFWDLFLPVEEVKSVKDVFTELRVGYFPNTFENHWISKDGNVHLIMWSNTALLDAESSVEYIIGTGIDISKRKQAEDALKKARDELEIKVQERTAEYVKANDQLTVEIDERKQIEEALRESEERYRSLINRIQAAVVVHDSETQIIASNPKAQELLGLTEDQMLGKTAVDSAWKFLTAEGGIMPLEEYPVNQVLATRKPLRDLVVGIYRPNKVDQVWVLANADPVFDYKGNIQQVIVTFVDITERKKAEEALRKSETLLRETGKIAKVGGWELDAKTLEVSWTEETFRIHEVPLGQKPPLEEAINFYHPEDRPKLETAIQKALDHGEPYDMEIRFITAKGKHLWTRTNCKPLVVDGKTIKLTGTFQDITDHKRTEEALRDSRERFRDLTESTSDWVWEVDREGVYTYSSPKVVELLGYDPEEVKGKKPFDFMPSAEAKRVTDIFNNFISSQAPFESIENINLHKNGSPVVMETSGVPYFNTEGKFLGYRGIDRDITKRKRAEEALRKSETKHKALIKNIPGMVYRAFPDWSAEIVSGSENISGYTNAELNSKEKNWLSIIHPDDIEQVFDKGSELANTPKDIVQTYRIITKDGKIRWVEDHKISLFSEEGDFIGIEGIVFNITERKQAEDEKENFMARLLQAQKMEAVGTLAGGIAHQFNNALSGITVSLDLLELDLPDDENIKGYTEQMRQSAHRMTQLTSQLLAYARGGKYQAKTISASDFIRDTVPLIRRDIHPGIDVETNLSRDILPIKADLIQMQMVLSAVLKNSSEAMQGKGRIQISTKNEEIDEAFINSHPDFKPGSYVSITVADEGKGMEVETKNRIFEPFFTTDIHGRGLGMAAVYGIVKNHNGYTFVDSELGKGTTISILLPAIEENSTKTEKSQIKTIKGTGTILVIEDEEMVMSLNRAILERLGYRVLEAKTGKEAIDIAETFDGDIDLALLDLLLPDMDGKGIYPLLVKARPKMKVIICSGYSINGPAKEILDAGAEDFIQKPFTITTLSDKLKKVFME